MNATPSTMGSRTRWNADIGFSSPLLAHMGLAPLSAGGVTAPVASREPLVATLRRRYVCYARSVTAVGRSALSLVREEPVFVLLPPLAAMVGQREVVVR